MRGPLQLLPVLFSATLLGGLPCTAAGEPTRWCAGDFGFRVEAPDGWTVRSEHTALGLALSFEPAAEGGEPTVAIGVLVPSESSDVAELEPALAEWLGLIGGFGRPLETRRVELLHPELRTRAAAVLHPSGEIHLAVVGAEKGRVFHVTMARLGGRAIESELDTLRAVVASLRTDGSARCGARPRSAPAADAP